MPFQPSGFIGFPDTKMQPVIVPDLFFVDLLPQIDDLAELKLTLHCFWLLNTQESAYRYLAGAELRSDETLLASLNLDSDLRTPQATLEDALQRAVARNTLLRLEITTGPEVGAANADANPDGNPEATVTEDWYFMNTVKGRQAVAMIRQGRLAELQAVIPSEARLTVDRPNIFVLYEQNVGMMTPLIAEQLRDMEKSFPPDWVQEAFEIAVSRNKRALRYIQAILKRWETDGKDEESHENVGDDSLERRRKAYLPDEYSDIIRG